MGTNQDVKAGEIRSELKAAGFYNTGDRNGIEYWRNSDGTTCSFRPVHHKVLPGDAKSCRDAIAEASRRGSVPGSAIGAPNVRTRLDGTVVPKADHVYQSAAGFRPNMPIGTMIVVLTGPPFVKADAPTLGKYGLDVSVWDATEPETLPARGPYAAALPIAPVVAAPDEDEVPAPLRGSSLAAPRRDQVVAWISTHGTTGCTVEDIATGLDVPKTTVSKSIQEAVRQKLIRATGDRHTRRYWPQTQEKEAEVSAPFEVVEPRPIPWTDLGLGSDVTDKDEAARRIARLLALADRVRSAAGSMGINYDNSQPIALVYKMEQAYQDAKTAATTVGASLAAQEKELQAAHEWLTSRGVGGAGRSISARLPRATSLAVETPPSPPAPIPGWTDEQVAALTGRLADPSVLRLILGREPTREDLLAIALRALAERLGVTP